MTAPDHRVPAADQAMTAPDHPMFVAGSYGARPPAQVTTTGTSRLLRDGTLPGAAAGLVGGLIFGLAMLSLGTLPTVASIIRLDSPYAGFAVHMAIAAMVGAGFGTFVARQRAQTGELLFWGLSYGAFWWFLGPQTLLPLLLGRPVAWDLAGAQALLPSLIGHLFYGATTALAFVAIRPAPPVPPTGLRPWPLRPWTLLRGLLAGILAAAVILLTLGARADLPAGLFLAAGSALGLGYPLLFTGRPEGTGPALIRGTVYGFMWWVLTALTLPPLFEGGTLDWSRQAVTDGAARLPAYLLLGAVTAVIFTWIGALGRSLFLDDVRLLHEEAPGTRGLRATAHGIVAGLGGGLVFTGVMLSVDILPTVAGLIGARGAVVGFVVHLVIAQIIGVSYALLFRRRSFDPVSGLGWGVSYGFVWWVLGWLTLLPILLGNEPRWNAAAMGAVFPALVGHLMYGAALGLVHQWLEARTNPWWETRNQVEAERMAARQQQTLGSAPALWTLTTLIALIIPLLVTT